uniref:Uncharacterized protein n=1 Tax=Rhizophora mucronata TaxID=61149 RepID=A0A2P2P889_RHIMU
MTLCILRAPSISATISGGEMPANNSRQPLGLQEPSRP